MLDNALVMCMAVAGLSLAFITAELLTKVAERGHHDHNKRGAHRVGEVSGDKRGRSIAAHDIKPRGHYGKYGLY